MLFYESIIRNSVTVAVFHGFGPNQTRGEISSINTNLRLSQTARPWPATDTACIHHRLSGPVKAPELYMLCFIVCSCSVPCFCFSLVKFASPPFRYLNTCLDFHHCQIFFTPQSQASIYLRCPCVTVFACF